MIRKRFFTSADHYRGYHRWSCQNVCDALSFLLDNNDIRFCTKLYRQIVGIPMGANYAPLVADLFLFCFERDFMKDLSNDNQATLLRHSTQLILQEWSTKFILLNYNLIKLIFQITRPPFFGYTSLYCKRLCFIQNL